MAENPRELIRAAQSAETQGDVARAVECLQKAAELYRQSGNPSRALQLLRHAQRLDGSRADIAEAVNRLEWMPDPARAGAGPDSDDEEALAASGVETGLLLDVVHRQRLIEDALREAALLARDDTPASAAQAWVIETEVTEDSQRLEAQLARVAGEGEGDASGDEAEVPFSSHVASARAQGDRSSTLGWSVAAHGMNVPTTAMSPPESAPAVAPGMSVPSASLSPAESASAGAIGISVPSMSTLSEGNAGNARWGALQDAGETRPSSPALEGGDDGGPAGQGGLSDAPPRRRKEARLIERGPTRADAALDAWCSFCCRPRTDTGDLVAGPAGAFICKSCLNESQSLLGDVTPVPPPAVTRTERPVEPVMGLVGQQAAQSLLTQSLDAQARCLLVVGPEGSGKSVWFQQLQRDGVGAITSVADLDAAGTSRVLLVEDVDRLDATSHAALRAFLARDSRPSLYSAREAWARRPGGSCCAGTRGAFRCPPPPR
ncbi:ClpX C4-type zinc finger protein [Myxococcus sp. 1LA]